MKRSEFCEKEFEILFCREFLNRYKCDFFFPSQRQEVRLGFDALFKGKTFKARIFQFKVVSQYAKNPFGHKLNSYSFPTHKGVGNSQNQHNALVNFNNTGLRASYVVPCFVDRADLLSSVKSNSLMSHCRSLIPKFPLSPGNHTIKYDTLKAQQFCDKAEDLKISSGFTIEDSPEIVYDKLLDGSIINEQRNLFDLLTRYKMAMMYKFLS